MLRVYIGSSFVCLATFRLRISCPVLKSSTRNTSESFSTLSMFFSRLVTSVATGFEPGAGFPRFFFKVCCKGCITLCKYTLFNVLLVLFLCGCFSFEITQWVFSFTFSCLLCLVVRSHGLYREGKVVFLFCRDLKPADSELLYLESARKIPLYGMELHDVRVCWNMPFYLLICSVSLKWSVATWMLLYCVCV